MAQTNVLQVSIEPALIQQAEELFHKEGLDTNSAVIMFFKKVVVSGRIPFNIHAETPAIDKKAEAKLAFERLQSYKKILPENFDYKKELEEVRSKKYEKYENSLRH